MNILILPRYGRQGASSRLRLYQYIDWFEKAGLRCNVLPLINDSQLKRYYETGKYSKADLIYAYVLRIISLLKIESYSLILIEKEALPWLPAWFEKVLLSRVPYVLDFDHGHDILHLDESGSGAVSMKDGRVVHVVDLQNHKLMKQTTL